MKSQNAVLPTCVGLARQIQSLVDSKRSAAKIITRITNNDTALKSQNTVTLKSNIARKTSFSVTCNSPFAVEYFFKENFGLCSSR